MTFNQKAYAEQLERQDKCKHYFGQGKKPNKGTYPSWASMQGIEDRTCVYCGATRRGLKETWNKEDAEHTLHMQQTEGYE